MSVIRRLEESVINRIAAGEVVQRPSAAIKELIENSLDAGATSITIVVKAGGLSMLQIQDNGHGIRKEDLEIVCERFTTSKLSKYEDLRSIETFGFRGEALASITHVSHVTILTKTKNSPCAYKTKYCDGKLVPLRPGEKTEPKPCAGVVGTTITIEDLFYNMPTRKQAFKNLNEEYQRILDVVTKYSILYGDSGVAFICKKFNSTVPDLHTLGGNLATGTLENIKLAYTSNLARELIDFNYSPPTTTTTPTTTTNNNNTICSSTNNKENNELSISFKGKVSNANYSAKKLTFILFINNRLVDCIAMKKTIESVYSDILPRHMFPFVYLSIRMPPQDLDVNVHPTKKEVHFLYEEEVLALLHTHLAHTLRSSNDSRHFQVQTVLQFADSSSNMMPISSYNSSNTTVVEGGRGTLHNATSLKPTSSTSSMFLQTPISPTTAPIAGTLTTPTTTQQHDQDENPDDEEAEFDFSQARDRDYLTSKRPRREKIESSFNDNTQQVYNTNTNTNILLEDDEEEQIIFTNQHENTRNTIFTSNRVLTHTNNDNINNTKAVIAPKKLVRTDPKLVKIDSIFKPTMGSIEEENKPNGLLACECETPIFTSTRNDDRDTDKINDQMGEETTYDSECEVTGINEPEEPMIYAGICNDSSNIIPNMSCLCCNRAGNSSRSGRNSREKQLSIDGATERANTQTNSSNTATTGASATTAGVVRFPELRETHCRYDSIQTLIKQIKDSYSTQLQQMLHNYTFVGIIDSYFSVIQYDTKLLLMDHSLLIHDLMYQLIMRQFGELDMYILSEPLSIYELINIGLDNEEKEIEEIIIRKERISENKEDNHIENNPKKKERKDKIALIYDILCSKSGLLLEYFGVHINVADGKLYSIPIVLSNYTPYMDTLPLLLLNLVREVNWESELECFHSIAVCLAEFYSYLRTEHIAENKNSWESNDTTTATTTASTNQSLPRLTKESERLLTGILYPALRTYLLPNRKHSNNGTVIQIAALEQLYKVFERC